MSGPGVLAAAQSGQPARVSLPPTKDLKIGHQPREKSFSNIGWVVRGVWSDERGAVLKDGASE